MARAEPWASVVIDPLAEIAPVVTEPLCCGICGARADYVCYDAPPTCTLHKNSCCRAITPAVVVSYGDDLRFAVELARTAIDLAEQHGADQREVAGLRQALNGCCCGFVRTVKVRDRREFVPDGTMVQHEHYEAPQPGGEFKVTGESFEEHCRACKLETQISVYERNIRKLAAQVREERIRQEKAKQKRTLSELKRKGVIP